MTSAIIFFDESGFTGNKLLDEKQPFFVYASVAIEPGYARNLIERVIRQRGLQGSELKASKLLKHGRGRAAIDDVLKEVMEKSRIVLWDKKYALATLIYEYLFEPSLSHVGKTLYSIGLHRYVSSLLYLMFRTKAQAMDQLFANFEAFMHHPDEPHLQELLETSSGSSDASIVARRGVTDDVFTFCMCHLKGLVIEVNSVYDGWMLDLTFMSLFPLLSHWGEQYDELEVVCDASKPLYAVKDLMTHFLNRRDRVYVPTYGTGRTPMLVTPSLSRPLRFADSKSCQCPSSRRSGCWHHGAPRRHTAQQGDTCLARTDGQVGRQRRLVRSSRRGYESRGDVCQRRGRT
jgi:hypothetical protein